MFHIRAPQELGAAFIFLVVGLAGLFLGSNLHGMQDGGQLGSGTMPYILSWICVGFSGVMLFRAISIAGPAIERVPWRGLISVSLAVVLFGVLVENVGYLPSAILTPLVAALAMTKLRKAEAILVAVLLGAATSVLFVILLGQPLQLWGGAF